MSCIAKKLEICLSVCLSVSLYIYLSIYLFIYLFIYLSGFRANYSTTSAYLVLKETVLNYTHCGSDVYACFVDISKAFDSVDHSILMQKLVEYRVPELFVKLIKELYSNQNIKVKYMSKFSEEWHITNGVRQGGVLSGLFFAIYIDSLITNISKMKFGCKLGLFMSNIITYADDIVLLAPSRKGLQNIINELYNGGIELGLRINLNKSKCLVFNGNQKSLYKTNISPFFC